MSEHSRTRTAIVSAALVVAAWAVFWPLTSSEFVSYDDPKYVTQNPNVQKGITAESLAWAFGGSHASNWHPVTWISHMLDCQLFGLNAGGHHAMNLLLHSANAVLLFLALRRMSGGFWQSASVAALFAVHPLHVESVAWVAERKDVLSTFFWALALYAYAVYAEKPNSKGYLLVSCFLVLGLMSKPMLVTFPFLLLLLDFWPLGRFRDQIRVLGVELNSPAGDKVVPRYSASQLVQEKIPFFVMIALSCFVTLWAQQETMQDIPLTIRVSNAVLSYGRYVWKMIWPMKLIVHYAYPGSISLMSVVLVAASLAAVSVLAVRNAKRHPYLLVGWLWFLGTLIPTIGIIQVGNQAMADRYTYIPLIGLFIVISWGASAVHLLWRLSPKMLGVIAVVVIGAYGTLAHSQVRYWCNSIALYQHVLEVAPGDFEAEYNLGLVYLENKELDKAREHFERAAQTNPSSIEAWNNVAGMWRLQGNLEEAVKVYGSGLKFIPNHAGTHYNLGVALAKLGRLNEAVSEFQTVLQLAPEFHGTHKDLGRALVDLRRFDEGFMHLNEYMQLNPTDGEGHLLFAEALRKSGDAGAARNEYATALMMTPALVEKYSESAAEHATAGRTSAAIDEYALLTNLQPDDATAHEKLALLFAQNGNAAESITEFVRVAELRPDAQSQFNLAQAYELLGKPGEAVAYYRKALELKPDWPSLLNNLAWMLATSSEKGLRNGVEAVRLAEKACELTQRKQARFLGTLDAAYAEAGRFEEASSTAETARKLALSTLQPDVASAAEARLKLYAEKVPYHMPEPPRRTQ